MALSHNGGYVFALVLAGLSIAPAMQASSFSFTGVFTRDDNVQLFGFNVSGTSAVTVETWSYGGGVDALGQTIAAGGFSPILSLYSASGSLIDFDLPGPANCPPAKIDPASGMCGDALLSRTLSSGNYLLAVTEYFNTPNGANLAAGFLENGAGNFTGPLLCGTQGSFYDPGCNKRSGNFEVDITGAVSASAVPEPTSMLLAGFGLAFLAAASALKDLRRKLSDSRGRS